MRSIKVLGVATLLAASLAASAAGSGSASEIRNDVSTQVRTADLYQNALILLDEDLYHAYLAAASDYGMKLAEIDESGNTRRQNVVLLSDALGEAELSFWEDVSVDDEFDSLRADWRACISSESDFSFESEPELLRTVDSLMDQGDSYTADQLVMLSRGCTADQAEAFAVAAGDMIERWAYDHEETVLDFARMVVEIGSS